MKEGTETGGQTEKKDETSKPKIAIITLNTD